MSAHPGPSSPATVALRPPRKRERSVQSGAGRRKAVTGMWRWRASQGMGRQARPCPEAWDLEPGTGTRQWSRTPGSPCTTRSDLAGLVPWVSGGTATPGAVHRGDVSTGMCGASPAFLSSREPSLSGPLAGLDLSPEAGSNQTPSSPRLPAGLCSAALAPVPGAPQLPKPTQRPRGDRLQQPRRRTSPSSKAECAPSGN